MPSFPWKLSSENRPPLYSAACALARHPGATSPVFSCVLTNSPGSTRNAGEDSPFQKLQLQVISAVAEFERALIRERQREGIAKANGKHLGRERKLTPEQEQAIRRRVADGEEKKALAGEFGISRQSLYRILKR